LAETKKRREKEERKQPVENSRGRWLSRRSLEVRLTEGEGGTEWVT